MYRSFEGRFGLCGCVVQGTIQRQCIAAAPQEGLKLPSYQADINTKNNLTSPNGGVTNAPLLRVAQIPRPSSDDSEMTVQRFIITKECLLSDKITIKQVKYEGHYSCNNTSDNKEVSLVLTM